MENPNHIYSYRNGVTPQDAQASTMLVALGGFVDAGHTQRLLTEHILSNHEHSLVASFDVDSLIDYRSRRPMLTFENNRFTAYSEPSIELHRVLDLDGTPFLLLSGIEPDYKWEKVVGAVRELIDDLGVSTTLMAHGIPMGVPHTRPISATAHSNDPTLIGGAESPFARVLVPGSVEGLLELRLSEAGKDVIGYSVHIPHYLAQIPMPQAAVYALDRLAATTGLHLQRAELAAAAEQADASLREELSGREDVAQVVAALEQQYDAYTGQQEQRSLPAAETELPSADEIAAEAEAFLRTLDEER